MHSERVDGRCVMACHVVLAVMDEHIMNMMMGVLQARLDLALKLRVSASPRRIGRWRPRGCPG